MKPYIISSIVAIMLASSCGDTGDTGSETRSNSNPITHQEDVKSDVLSPLLKGYFELSEALADGDSRAASRAAKQMNLTVDDINTRELSDAQQQIFSKLEKDLLEHTLHIEVNRTDIKHQREHFKDLSENMIELTASGNTLKPIYLFHCEEYSKGASWLDRDTIMENPYLGKRSNCGTLEKQPNR